MINQIVKRVLIACLILTAVGCTTAKERLIAEYEVLLHPNSVLLYEQAFVRSSATGDCSVTSINWWYGVEGKVDYQDLKDLYESQFEENGWTFEDENTWYKESKGDDLYISLEVFSDISSINRDQLYYFLPEFMLEINYQTIYLIDMTYRSEAIRKRCIQ